MKSIKKTQAEVEARFSESGYTLLGTYQRNDVKVLARCDIHDFEKEVFPSNIFKGGRMACCGKESMRAKLSLNMKGEGNHFFGKSHTEEMKAAMSKSKSGTNSPMFGKKRSAESIEKTRIGLIGKPRSSETKKKLSDYNLTLADNFDHCLNKAATSKTAGKPGHFYIAKVGDMLKFGSTTQTLGYRMRRLAQVHGDAELLMAVDVPDAAAYEASMMGYHREHWIRGEFFRDFRSNLAAA